MGKLAPLYFSILSIFLTAVLAGCSLEIAAGSVRFLNEEEADTGETQPAENGESPTEGLTPQ